MALICPHCEKELVYSGEPPSFCGYCREPLSANGSSQSGHFSSTVPFQPPAPSPLPEPAPTVVGDYRLLYKLGAGGMGTVYEAEHGPTGRRVAIKLLAFRLSGDPQQFERFQQEGRLASQINHPRSVFVYAADKNQGQPYIVMELMPGMTLEDQVKGQGPLPIEEAIRRTLEIIDGLWEAHRLGVIHRDVKPSNCFLLEDGSVKIGDFGLSKLLGHTTSHTESGAYKGTVIYSPPEQLRDEQVDFRADIYSVTATLFFMLTGRAPFEGTSHIVAAARSASQPAPDVRLHRPEVPGQLARMIRKGLQGQRERRFQSLEDFRAALGGMLPSQSTRAGLGLRFGALLIDLAVLSVRFLVPPLLLSAGIKLHPLFSYALLVPIAVAYFAILEGNFGWSLGKRMLRLRVCLLDRFEPPGWRRAAVRALPLVLAFFVPRVIVESLPSNWPDDIVAVILVLMTTMAMFAIIWPMRPRNGYRGWHEILSGTRVIQLPWPEPRFVYRSKQNIIKARALPPELPPALGPFEIQGLLARFGERIQMLAEDRLLGRKVEITLYPEGEPGVEPRRRELARPNRQRWLTNGVWNNRAWDAFVGASGCPVGDLVEPGQPLNWAEARPILEQLARELADSESDQSLPATLSLEQVWVQEDGLLQLLDSPRETLAGIQLLTPLRLLQETAILLLEGRRPSPHKLLQAVRAPLPGHVLPMLERLMGLREQPAGIDAFLHDLEATRSRPRRVSFVQKAAFLSVMGILLSVGLAFMYAQQYLVQYAARMDPNNVSRLADYFKILDRIQTEGPQTKLRIVGTALSMPVIFWPAAWTIWAFFFRGGLSLRIMGLRLVRSDGRPASRFQCAFRTMLVWMPVTLLLLLTNFLSIEFRDHPDYSLTVWCCAIGLPVAYAYLSMISPARTLHDWLAGVWLVPD